LARRKTIDLGSQARVAVRRAVLLMRRGRMPEAVEAARNAVRIAQAGRDLAREAEARARLGQAVALSGQREEGDRELGLAWDRAAASGDAAVRARAAASRAFVLVSRGEHAKALAWRGTARSEFTAAGRVREATTECLNTGSALLALGDYPAAQAMLDEALHLSRELGLRRTEGFASLNLGLLFCRIGDVRKGLEATTVALAAARTVGEPRLAVAALVYRAMVHLSAGDTPAALSDVNDALGGEFESTNVAFARAARACVYAALGRHQDVLTEAQAAWAGRDVAGGMEELEIDLQLAQYDALLALGRQEKAVAILSAARARYEERLAHIEEPRLRQAFRENVPAHRRLAELLNA
jgi:tetratricopeptide (TPR) repeat protein